MESESVPNMTRRALLSWGASTFEGGPLFALSTSATSEVSDVGLEDPAIATRQLSESSFTETEWFNILAQILSGALLFLLIFGMSATVNFEHLKEQMKNKFAILTGIATQFVIMPLLGYLSVLLLGRFGMSDPMAISLLIVTASPGGSYSNWWCSMFNADLALSVTMTAISTMVSTVMLPANLLLYVNAAFGVQEEGEESILSKIDWGSLFVSLAIVILAISLGLLASFKISSRRFNRFANKVGSISGVLLIVFSGLVASLTGEHEAKPWRQPWAFYVGVTSPCLVGLFIATGCGVLARLKRPEIISVGVECCYQNVGIATTASVAMFQDPTERGQALCVPLFYGMMEAIVLGIYCLIGWKLGWTKAPREEKFCTMLVKTYEVPEGDSRVEDLEQMDDEINGGDATNPDWGDAPPKKSWFWSLFGEKNPPTAEEEEDLEGGQSSPRRASTVHPLASDSIADAITDLVCKEKDVEYQRCRVNSEDTATISTEASASTRSPTSFSSNSRLSTKRI
mmetsp:Transcript_26916/g.60453  ORF Transcript_26916/g.60453 Transcript_26916/m.60453 type:complete len:513 (-) Transcript_26916:75-1613(-)